MASLYSRILTTSFPNPRGSLIQAFHAVIGAVIFLRRPLSSTSICRLLSIDETTMQHICNNLKPVVEMGNVLQITHQSFVDYILDSESCAMPFCITKKIEERRLALACMRTMRSGLRFNICDIKSSYSLNADIEDLKARIRNNIPDYLYYSSRYWVDHLVVCPESIEIIEDLEYILQNQFLFWLEILSVSKQMNVASRMLSTLIDWMKDHSQDDSVANDLQKFVRSFANVIAQSVPHIYISALSFAPHNSIVSKLYRHLYSCGLTVESGGLERWPACHFAIEANLSVMTFSPDGQKIVLGNASGAIEMYDSETGELVGGSFTKHNGAIIFLAFSPNGEHIVSADDKRIMIRNIETGEIVSIHDNQDSGQGKIIALSPCGLHFASISEDKRKIRVYSLDTNRTLKGALELHSRHITVMQFSSNGQHIAIGSSDNAIRLWSLEKREAVTRPWRGHPAPIQCITLSENGQKIASASGGHTAEIWDTSTGSIVSYPLEGHTDAITCIAFSLCGNLVALGSYDNTVSICDADTGEMISGRFQGHIRSVEAIAFSPDGRRIVSSSWDGTIRVWDANVEEPLVGLSDGHTEWVRSVVVSHAKRWIISASDDMTIGVWDVKTGGLVLPRRRIPGVWVFAMAISRDGRRVAFGSIRHMVYVWDVETDEVMGPFKGHSRSVSSVALSFDGKYIVSGANDIRVWHTETGQLATGPLMGHNIAVTSVVFAPIGWNFVSGFQDGTVRVWDSETGEVVAGPFQLNTSPIAAIDFSPDGEFVVSGSDNGSICIWDSKTGETIVGPFQEHKSRIGAVIFSPNGQLIATGSWDNSIKIWDARSGEMITTFQGHIDWVLSLAFLSDFQIASGSVDRTIRIWDVDSSINNDTSPFTDDSIMVKGWVFDSESRPLFWVPPELQEGLLRPGNKFIVSNAIQTRLNLDAFIYGERWTSCRKPDPQPQISEAREP